MFRKNNYIKLCTHLVYALSEFRLNWRGMCRKCSCGCFFFFFSSMFLQCLPFQQTQCFAAGKLTERLGITYLTDSISSVVSKKKKKKEKKVLVYKRENECSVKSEVIWRQMRQTQHNITKSHYGFYLFWQTFFQKAIKASLITRNGFAALNHNCVTECFIEA